MSSELVAECMRVETGLMAAKLLRLLESTLPGADGALADGAAFLRARSVGAAEARAAAAARSVGRGLRSAAARGRVARSRRIARRARRLCGPVARAASPQRAVGDRRARGEAACAGARAPPPAGPADRRRGRDARHTAARGRGAVLRALAVSTQIALGGAARCRALAVGD